MTVTEPTDVSVSPSDPWQQQERACARIASEVLKLNKTAVFDALAAAGITTVIVTLDGYGDSGQIEEIDVSAGDDASSLSAVEIETTSAHWGGTAIDLHLRPVRGAILVLVYDLLSEAQGGCEINEGNCSTFTFDISERTITLDYNEQHMRGERASALAEGGPGYAEDR